MKKNYRSIIWLLVLTTSLMISGVKASQIDWPKFMARQDMIWKQMPKKWDEAPFLGNGNMGSMIYQEGEKRIRLQMFRTDVQDHRDNSYGWTAYSRPRFILGSFYLETSSRITGADLRLNLWDATLTGTIITESGKISVFHLIHTDDMAGIFNTNVISGTESLKWSWEPGKAETTRKGYPRNEDQKRSFAKSYGQHHLKTLKLFTPNPEHVIEKIGRVNLCTQNLFAGGQYATAWQVSGKDKEQTLIMSVCNSYPEKTSANEAVRIVKSIAKTTDNTQWIAEHKQWWHGYYPLSFVSLPDARLESFYWIQMYKMACATRSDRPMMDTSGPWFQATPWPYITWDLNVQLCYWPTYASNRITLAESLPNILNKNKQNLIDNVRPASWQSDSAYISTTSAQDLKSRRDGDMRYYDCVGNLPWTMHNCWLQYRHTMDDRMLREQVYPLLKRSINLYFHLSYEDRDSRIHLKPTYSPEYHPRSQADCNYDLALFKWGCQTLLWTCERLGIDDPLKPKWKAVVDRLIDYPTNENGFMIGAKEPYKHSHRHYAHLIMMYPLYLVNIENSDSYELMDKSLKHWIGLEHRLKGYSFTGASSISASMGNGDDSLKYLKGLEAYLLPNTLYKEAGPCMETPLSGAQCIHDMLIQSWGNKIRIFPAVASDWKDVEFENMLAEGAFLVSASRKDGKTNWIKLKSLKGEKGFALIPNFADFEIRSANKKALQKPSQNLSSTKQEHLIDLSKGRELLIVRKGYKGPIGSSPVKNQIGQTNSFGLK